MRKCILSNRIFLFQLDCLVSKLFTYNKYTTGNFDDLTLYKGIIDVYDIVDNKTSGILPENIRYGAMITFNVSSTRKLQILICETGNLYIRGYILASTTGWTKWISI